MKAFSKLTFAVLSVALIGVTSLVLSRAKRSSMEEVNNAIRERPARLARADRLRSGHHRVLVFIGSSTCGASSDPELHERLERIASFYREQSLRSGGYTTTLGVALDWDTNDGLRFLNKMGAFDEISIGRNWLNSHSVAFVWRDLPGAPTLPQLVVVEREVEVGPSMVEVGRDSVVARFLGLDEIRRHEAKLIANANANAQ